VVAVEVGVADVAVVLALVVVSAEEVEVTSVFARLKVALTAFAPDAVSLSALAATTSFLATPTKPRSYHAAWLTVATDRAVTRREVNRVECMMMMVMWSR
jgi:hypothetical protein